MHQNGAPKWVHSFFEGRSFLISGHKSYQRKILLKMYSYKITKKSYLSQKTHILITSSLCRKEGNKDMFTVVKS